jgi:hypothetical protein
MRNRLPRFYLLDFDVVQKCGVDLFIYDTFDVSLPAIKLILIVLLQRQVASGFRENNKQ